MIAATDLRLEAAAEVRRLTAARALVQPGDESVLVDLDGGGAWIAFPRRSRVRRALGGRICLVWRVAFEDASGRCVEARVVPALVHTDQGYSGRPLGRVDRIRLLLRDAEDEIRAQVEAACDEWASATVSITQAFVAARLAREKAIERLPLPTHIPSQPGLFDRRAERAQQARAAIHDGAHEATAHCTRSIVDRSTIARQPARLLLVLLP